MKIKTALMLFTALMFLVFGAMSLLLTRTSNLLEAETNSVARAANCFRVSEEIKSHLLLYNRTVFLYALHKNPSRLEASRAHQVALANLILNSDQLADNDQEALAISLVKEKVSDYFIAKDRIYKTHLPPVEKYRQLIEKTDAAFDAIDIVIEINTSQMRDLFESIHQQNTRSAWMVYGLLIVASFILLGLVTAMISAAALPLADLSKIISKYHTGNGAESATAKGLKEIQEIANNFNLMTNRLEESRNDQLRFIASIAHDLRNPISSMSMASELLIREGPEKERRIAQMLFRQVKHLNRLVGDLLDTARIETSQMNLELSLQDVSFALGDAIELHRVASSRHKLNIEMPTTPLICNCDRGRLSQVMNNLISNAIKYSPNGGNVTVKAWEENSQIVITVTDQGMGVSQEDLNQIFKPFHRSKATKDTIPGIGLGLSSSRKIVELHGGQLTAESTIGKGSTFYVSLPTQAKVQITSQSEREKSPPTSKGKTGREGFPS